MKLLYGTANGAKLEWMKRNLNGMDIDIMGLGETDILWPAVAETGNDPLENARIKARAYFEAARMPVFSCDCGLYIEGLEDALQPGVHVRNVGGRRLNDEQMIAHYSGLAKRCGGSCVARYRYAVCLILDENTVYESMEDELAGEKFILAYAPHPKRRKGFPLDSLSVHIGSGRYYYDLEEPRVSGTAEGFRRFFRRSLRI